MGSLKIILCAHYWFGWKGCGRLITVGFRGGGCFPHCQLLLVKKKKKKERHCIEKQNKERKMSAADTIVLSLIAAKILKQRINEVLKMKW